ILMFVLIWWPSDVNHFLFISKFSATAVIRSASSALPIASMAKSSTLPKGSAEDFRILASKEYGASYALLELARDLGLDRALYSRKEAWVQDCLAMIVGRIVYAGSKLALSNQWKNTALWELSGVEGKVDVDLHCYL